MELENITRQELLKNIVVHRKALEDALSQVPDEDYLEPTFAGGWTLKDILAHIVAWEQRMIGWIDKAQRGILPDVPGSDEALEALNARIYEENKDLPLKDVREAFARSFTQAMGVAETTPEEVLFTKNLIEGREHPYWITVAANTWWHYKDHHEDLTTWLEKKPKQT